MFRNAFPKELVLLNKQFNGHFCVVHLVNLEMLTGDENKVSNRSVMLFGKILKNRLQLLYKLVAFLGKIELLEHRKFENKAYRCPAGTY